MRSESIEELERTMSEDSGGAGDKKPAKSGFVSFVSRSGGLAKAKSIGAHAYFECSELSCGDLDRLVSALIGAAAAARMEYMQNEAVRRESESYFSLRASVSNPSVA